jgi:hypothetical protein
MRRAFEHRAHSISMSAAALFVGFVGLLASPEGSIAAQQTPDATPTFASDVALILQENCQVCHRPGAIGPMSLLTYEEVRPWGAVIREKVSAREMPPYHYDSDVGVQGLKGDMRLSEREIETILAWVDGGMPMGDPDALPAPVTWPDPGSWRLAERYGEPDVVIASAPYDVPATGQDIWWQPSVPTGLTESRCIKAIETKPSVPGRAFTHHANSTIEVRTADGNLRPSGRLSEYALGKLGEIVPDDACRTIPADSYISWDIHYYPAGEAVPGDQVEVGIWFHDDEAFDRQAAYRQDLTLYFLQGGDYDIPPHGKLMTQGFHSFDHPVRIDSWQPHGHTRLRGMALEIFDPATGRREMVSMVSNWSALWHLSHVYEDDVAPLVPTGAVMILTAWYDNTADNPYNPDPDQWVATGQRTADEMSHAWIAVTHLDQAGYDRLVSERQQGSRSGNQAGAP